MKYIFQCHKCNKRYEIEMPISKYESKGHICECGEELERSISDYAGGVVWNTTGSYARTSI